MKINDFEGMMVWSITKNGILVRKAVSADEAWSVNGPAASPPPDCTVPDQVSEWVLSHRWDLSNTRADMVAEFKATHGLEHLEFVVSATHCKVEAHVGCVFSHSS